MTDDESTINEILDINERLLESIAAGDWAAYQELCDPTLTAFEPEARGHLVEGLEFHQFYFELGGATGPYNVTVCNPHVRLLGDTAVVSYIRLVQRLDDAGKPATHCSEETRIWHRQDGRWQHVHFHRSTNG
jgi:ketosteroid isomerase-like protein